MFVHEMHGWIILMVFKLSMVLYFDLRGVIRSICHLYVRMPQLSGPCGHQLAILIDKVTGLGMELAAQCKWTCYINRQGDHLRPHTVPVQRGFLSKLFCCGHWPSLSNPKSERRVRKD